MLKYAVEKEQKDEGKDDHVKSISSSLAKDVPGYSEDCYTISDEDATDKTRIINEDLNNGSQDVKKINLCKRVDEKAEGANKNKGSESKFGKTKVTMPDLAQCNDRLVNEKDSDQLSLRKYLCHERLYRMMKSKSISKDKSL